MEGPLREDEQRVMDEFASALAEDSGESNSVLDRQPPSDGSTQSAADTTRIPSESWKPAVRRLYRTLLSVSGPQSGYSNPEQALDALLDSVAKSDQITEKQLLDELIKRSVSNPPTEGTTVEAIPVTDRQRSPSEFSSEDDGESGEAVFQKRHELLQYLTAMGKLLTANEPTDLDHNESLLHEKITSKFQSIIESAVHKLHDQWELVLNVFLPRQQLQTLILVSLVNVISVQRVFALLPYIICYISFAMMIYSTLTMFGSRTWLRRIEHWKRLLTLFQTSNNDHLPKTSIGESFYSWKSTEPYITYFIASILFIFSLALIGNGQNGMVYLPNSWAMCGLSAFFAVLCFLALADRHDVWAVGLMALDIISSSPGILQKFGVRVSGIPIVGLLLRNWQICQVGLINIQIGLPSMAVLIIILIYAGMLLIYPRRDVYTVVIPQIVCMAWWHISLELFLVNDFRSFFTFSGWYEVALTIGVIWLITFPTMAAFAMVAAILIAQMRMIFDHISLLKTCITATILFLPFIYRKVRQWMEKRTMISSKKGQLKKTMLALIIYGLLVFTSAAILFESKFQTDSTGGKLAKELTWTKYEQHCSYGDEDLGNRLRQQIACSQLGGKLVKWKGTIQGVRIVKIDNIFETVLSYLPGELASTFRCFYGERMNETTTTGTVMQGLDSGCNLIKYNVYTFEIDVAGPWGQHTFSSAKGAVILVVSSAFQELAMEFEQGDVVEFKASFMAGSLLKYPPKLKLIELQCLACQHVSPEQHSARFSVSYGDTLWMKLFNACRYLFNFICSPLFVMDGI